METDTTQTAQPTSEVIRFEPQPKQSQFLAADADIVVFGGAAGGGKTWALLYEPLYHIKNPAFGALVFRRTYPQITLEGGLWDESESLYPFAGATPTKGNLKWQFPSGATVVFRSMENETDRYNYDGAQIPLIEFDQLESFTEKQFFYLLSRNRSTCGVRPYVRASANPQPGWLANFLQWWWDDQSGYAIPERSGKVRWFCRVGDGLRWAGSAEELKRKHPGAEPKSVSFIFSKLDDNQVLMRKDPGYLSNLMALPLVDRERLLGGNWKISVAGNIFKREWWKFADRLPEGCFRKCRFWDIAATVPEAGNNPDWTAGVLVAEHQGYIYIVDVVHFQGSPLTNERTIKSTAELDGPSVMVRMEQEGGASGKSLSGEEGHYARNVLVGYNYEGVPSSKKKLLRWSPLSAAVEQGRVYLVRAKWNQDFVDELEGCKGEDEKNDQCLVAGTIVTCERGDVPIEQVVAGDRVLTRQGYKGVEWAGLTGFARSLAELTLADGRTLIGTKNHLAFSKERGFIRFDAAIGALDLICLKNTNWNGLKKTEQSIAEANACCAKEFVDANGPSGPQDSSDAAKPIIETYGSRITGERSQTGHLFTTETGIMRITRLRILSALPTSGTRPYILSAETLTQKTREALPALSEPELRRRNGTVARQVLSGTSSKARSMVLSTASRSSSNVLIAGNYSRRPFSHPGAARSVAPARGEEIFQRTKSNLNVANADQCFPDSKRMRVGQGQSSAATSVASNRSSEKGQPVYNLKVRGVPEFFANGILVHNCDAAAGALEALRKGGAFSNADFVRKAETETGGFVFEPDRLDLSP